MSQQEARHSVDLMLLRSKVLLQQVTGLCEFILRLTENKANQVVGWIGADIERTDLQKPFSRIRVYATPQLIVALLTQQASQMQQHTTIT